MVKRNLLGLFALLFPAVCMQAQLTDGTKLANNDGRIELSGLAQDAVVVVYSMDGRMVARESGENVSIAVPAGKYVVRVVADGKAVSRVVMMR